MALWEAIYSSFILAGCVTLLLRNMAPPDAVMAGGLALLMVARVLDPAEALAGFANESLLSVVALFVVAAGIAQTGGLDHIFAKLLGSPKSLAGAQVRVLLPVAIVSAFFNNTPVIAIMVPVLQSWCAKVNIPVGKLFIPLSYASILGGTCTLIGTSTNLVVQGQVRERYDGDVTITMFELGKVGLPVALAGLIYIMLFSSALLPGESRAATNSTNATDFMIGASVLPESSAAGKSVEEAGLRGLPGLFLAAVQSGGRVIHAVGPDLVVHTGDILYFVGAMEHLPKVCLDFALHPLIGAGDVRDNELAAPSPTAGGASPSRKRARVVSETTTPIHESRTSVASTPRPGGPQDHAGYMESLAHSGATTPLAVCPKEIAVHAVLADSALMQREMQLRQSMDVASHSLAGPMHGMWEEGHAPRHMGLDQSGGGQWSGVDSTQLAWAIDPEILSAQLVNHQHATQERLGVSPSQKEQTMPKLVHATITRDGPLDGVTVAGAGFKDLLQASLVSIQRNGRPVNASSFMNLSSMAETEELCEDEDPQSSADIPCLVARGSLKEIKHHQKALGNMRLLGGDSVLLAVEPDFDLQGAASTYATHLEHITEVNFNVRAQPRETGMFSIPVHVETPCSFIGKDACLELSNIPGTQLVALERATGEVMHVSSGQPLIVASKDILWFQGTAASVVELRKIPGFELEPDQVAKLGVPKLDRRLVQAVLSARSRLVGVSVKDSHFRSEFNAAIVAIHRNGGHVMGKIGEVVLQAGDVLLLDCTGSFVAKHRGKEDFLLVYELSDSAPPRMEKLSLALLLGLMMIVLYIAEAADLITAALLAAGGMVLGGCLDVHSARNAVQWDVYITIACSFGFSAALEKTGVASSISELLVDAGLATGTGGSGVMVAIYLATVMLSNVMANNAAAAIMFPVAASTAEKQGMDLKQVVYLLMLAASASFASPFGYQTNLMIWNPGKYQFKDFIRFGGPMQVWQMIATLLAIILIDIWEWLVLLSIAGFSAVVAGPAVWMFLRKTCESSQQNKQSREEDAFVFDTIANGI